MTMKKMLAALAAGAALFGGADAEAGRLDAYRDWMTRRSFTVRYENVTPQPRATNKDKISFYGKDGMELGQADFLLNRQIHGVVVVDGADRYEEIGTDDAAICSLTLGGRVYIYTKDESKGRPVYYGSEGKNKVRANERNYLAMALTGQSYGDGDMTRLLGSILPPEKKAADMPAYRFVAAGRLANGQEYEDWRADGGDGAIEAVRYYFDGGTLVKIAAASYRRTPDGFDGKRTILKIRAFSSEPDRSLLCLPDGVKDLTKDEEDDA